MSDTKDWPRVPVDPACVPEGWEAIRVGRPGQGDQSIAYRGAEPFLWPHNPISDDIRLIIRPIPKPIKLPVTIVPPGWWVALDMFGDDEYWIYEHKPEKANYGYSHDISGNIYRLPPPIAAQLPEAYLALPWDQSLMQQTEGM